MALSSAGVCAAARPVIRHRDIRALNRVIGLSCIWGSAEYSPCGARSESARGSREHPRLLRVGQACPADLPCIMKPSNGVRSGWPSGEPARYQVQPAGGGLSRPSATWMSPLSPHGWVHGVSRKASTGRLDRTAKLTPPDGQPDLTPEPRGPGMKLDRTDRAILNLLQDGAVGAVEFH